MFKIHECLDTRSEITELKKLDNDLVAFSTRLHGVKIFTHKECTVKTNLANKDLNFKTTALCISPNSELLAFADKSLIYILNTSTHKLINTIQTNNIDIITFDPSSNYIIAGNKNGRVLQYRYNDNSLLSRPCSFPYDSSKPFKKDENFVSVFAFYKNRLAVSGYGGTVFLINLHSQIKKNIFTHNKNRINALCFLDKNTLISGDANGTIQILHAEEKNILKQIDTPFTNLKQIILMPNPQYIMVSSDTNYVSIIDIKNFKILHSKYIEFQNNIEKIAIADEDSLIVALENYKILKVELPSVKKLKSFILNNSLKKAFELTEKEPMLRNSKEYNMLEAKYKDIYLEATNALINQNKTLAMELTKMFKNISSKKEDIALLFKAFDNYNKFKALFLGKKFSLAYAISLKYPALQQTCQYKQMEQEWKKAFLNAQRQMVIGKSDNAKALLSPYATVALKRTTIKLILNQNREFLEFLQAVERKDYKKVYSLVKQNKEFSQIPTFTTLKNELIHLLQIIQMQIDKGNIDLANKNLLKFKDISQFSQEIKSLKLKSENMQKLQKAYKDKNLILCYEIIDTNENISSTQLVILLEKQWLEMIIKCEKFALKGNIKNIKEVLGKLIKLPTRKEKIGDLLRVSFHKKIQILIAEKRFKNAENIIYSYIDIFGIDNELNIIMQKFEKMTPTKLAITQEQNHRHSRDNWLYSNLW